MCRNNEAEQLEKETRSTFNVRASGPEFKALIILFLACLVIPINFNLETILLSPSRLFVVAAIVPSAFAWLRGKAGNIRTADILVVIYGIWTVISLVVVEGWPRLPYATMVAIETISPYLMARVIIKSEMEYIYVLRIYRAILVILAPVALYESITKTMPISVALGKIFTTYPKDLEYDLRLGLSRAQVVFEHPILFGIFSSMLLASAMVWANSVGRSKIPSAFQILPILVCIFLSLSSGAFVAASIQIFALSWGNILRRIKRRWTILVVTVAASLALIDIISNRTVFEVVASYLAFSSHNAYMRIHIFNFGLENVWNNPIFGLGLGEWIRPSWLPASVDNFWLVGAIRNGIPGFLLIASATLAVIVTMLKAKPKSKEIENLRNAHVICLTAIAIAITTVHIWSATYIMFMFLLGSGIWVVDRR